MSIVRVRRKDFVPNNKSDLKLQSQVDELTELVKSLTDKVSKLEAKKPRGKASSVSCPFVDKIDKSKMKDGMGLIWSSKEKMFTPQIILEEE